MFCLIGSNILFEPCSETPLISSQLVSLSRTPYLKDLIWLLLQQRILCRRTKKRPHFVEKFGKVIHDVTRVDVVIYFCQYSHNHQTDGLNYRESGRNLSKFSLVHFFHCKLFPSSNNEFTGVDLNTDNTSLLSLLYTIHKSQFLCC